MNATLPAPVSVLVNLLGWEEETCAGPIVGRALHKYVCHNVGQAHEGPVLHFFETEPSLLPYRAASPTPTSTIIEDPFSDLLEKGDKGRGGSEGCYWGQAPPGRDPVSWPADQGAYRVEPNPMRLLECDNRVTPRWGPQALSFSGLLKSF